ncbi:MAG: NAD(P)/FAD-dependent oxidoreductase [Haloferacaceae archaeon]
MSRSLCVVGAGAAGLGAAYALRDANVDVTILEKSRGVGGRAATRRRNGCTYDHGANYLKDDDERVAALVESLDSTGLVDIPEPVWTFDATGAIREGDREGRKWTWEAGITQLGERLLARTDATVEHGTRVEAVDRDERGWRVAAADGTTHGPFDGLLLTPPAPQTASLLASTGWSSERAVMLREAVGGVTYRSVLSVVLHYEEALDRPWYALVDTSKEHPLGWVGREECKAGHVPGGESLLVVQMGHEWSRERFDDPLEAVASEAARLVADLLDEDRLHDPAWVDDQRWRYALPERGAPADVLTAGRDDGLFFAGDWVADEGRVHAALRSGLETGEAIREEL